MFAAFHPDQDFVQKFLKPLHIGELAATEPSQDREKNVSFFFGFKELLKLLCDSQILHKKICVSSLSGLSFMSCAFQDSIIKDFDSLRVQTEKEGLFKAKPLFFLLHLGHIILLEALAWLSVCYWGTSWTMTFLCATLLATAQVVLNTVIFLMMKIFPVLTVIYL